MRNWGEEGSFYKQVDVQWQRQKRYPDRSERVKACIKLGDDGWRWLWCACVTMNLVKCPKTALDIPYQPLPQPHFCGGHGTIFHLETLQNSETRARSLTAECSCFSWRSAMWEAQSTLAAMEQINSFSFHPLTYKRLPSCCRKPTFAYTRRKWPT